MVGGAWFGGTDADALAGGAFQLHGLGGEREGADARVVEGLVCGLAAGDLIAFPQPGEVGALEKELADEVVQIRAWGAVPATARRRATQAVIWWSQSVNRVREAGWRQR